MGQGMRDQARLPVYTACELCVVFHGALRPQKPSGLLGTGEVWDRE